jgi:pyruvate/2-oxoglutarate dehydrogenase complex dihydrolipoamide acyltransferase (E2) component
MLRVAVPQIFENMEEATVGRWLVSEGQTLAEGQPLCELITEKTTLELPSPGAGTVRRLVVAEKAVVPAHFVIALIGEANEELPDVDAENAALREMPSVVAQMPLKVEAPQGEVPTPPLPVSGGSGRLRATPAARRAAKEMGVTLEQVAEAFPGKVLSEEDVKAFAQK